MRRAVLIQAPFFFFGTCTHKHTQTSVFFLGEVMRFDAISTRVSEHTLAPFTITLVYLFLCLRLCNTDSTVLARRRRASHRERRSYQNLRPPQLYLKAGATGLSTLFINSLGMMFNGLNGFIVFILVYKTNRNALWSSKHAFDGSHHSLANVMTHGLW